MMKLVRISSGILLAAMTTISLSAAMLRDGDVSQEVHKSYPLAANGTLRLHNINGKIQIKVWDKNEVKIDAVKYANDEEALDSVKIVINASSDRIDIDTKYPDNSDHHDNDGAGVDYVVTVPRTTSLDRIETINGRVEVSGVKGKVMASTINGTVTGSGLSNSCKLETVNGNVHADFSVFPAEAEMEIQSVNGSLEVTLPPDAGADVKANVTTGRITNDFGLESSAETHRHSFVHIGDSVDGKIGKGGARLRMSTVNGSIEISKSAEK